MYPLCAEICPVRFPAPPFFLRPGWWLGKAFCAGSPEGYNIFSPVRTAPSSTGSSDNGSFPDGTLRERFFGFSSFTKSVFDGGESSELDYGRGGKNGPLFGGMRDEVGSCPPTIGILGDSWWP